MKPFQVTGPDWVNNLHYDIAAKYPSDTISEDRLAMLRTLLEDRFRLAVHGELKTMPGYALTVSRKGFKLQPAESGGASDISTNGAQVRTLTAKEISMVQLADLMSRTPGRIVEDRTGKAGAYSFELRWSPEDLNSDRSAADSAPSLFTAIQETLGLSLQPQKVSVEIIAIDHVERVPAAN